MSRVFFSINGQREVGDQVHSLLIRCHDAHEAVVRVGRVEGVQQDDVRENGEQAGGEGGEHGAERHLHGAEGEKRRSRWVPNRPDEWSIERSKCLIAHVGRRSRRLDGPFCILPSTRVFYCESGDP